MPDMLVKLYELPDPAPRIAAAAEQGVEIRRAIPPEKHVVVGWVRETFGEAWGSECETAFSRVPTTCWVAVKEGKPVGFACSEASCRGFFGPTGVAPELRKKGIGAALLVACLDDMKAMGYGYAIIGGVGPADFYAKIVNAALIPDSAPGIYRNLLRR